MDENYPGINRLHYFLGKVGMIVAVVFVVSVFGPNSPVMKVLSLLLIVASLILDVMRLRNIGLSQWYALIRFLPLGNTVLDIWLQCAQTSWVETRRLDRAGRRILTVELVLLALMIFAFLTLSFSIPLL